MDMGFIKWINHAGFLIENNGKHIYIDPFALSDSYSFPKADMIFITHPHFDHFSMQDIRKIAVDGTTFVVPRDTASKISYMNVIAVGPNESGIADSTPFETIPAYNKVKERRSFHSPSSGWVGYVLKLNEATIYHAGDTDVINEMSRVDVDIALIPMGGTYTMDVDDAISATKLMKVKVVAPMHYKALLGKEKAVEAEEKFAGAVANAMIMKEIQEPTYSLQ